MENEEVIRLRMERTREALNEKLESLEEKVASSVAAVTDTVASVKDTVNESVQSVKGAVDVPAHVERHPWLMLGGSVLCGYVLGKLVAPDKASHRQSTSMPTPAPMERMAGNGYHQTPKQEAPAAGWLAPFEPEVRRLKSLALGATLGTIREMLTPAVPPQMAGHLRSLIDAVTEKVGGAPLPKSDWDAIKASWTPKAEPESSECNAKESRL